MDRQGQSKSNYAKARIMQHIRTEDIGLNSKWLAQQGVGAFKDMWKVMYGRKYRVLWNRLHCEAIELACLDS